MKHTLSFSKATFAASAFKYHPRARGRFGVVNTAWASLLGRTRSGYSSARRRLARVLSVTVFISSSPHLVVGTLKPELLGRKLLRRTRPLPLGECRGLRFVDDQVVDFTQPLNLDPTSLPRLHVARRHLCPAGPCRRARRQYVAGLERKGGGQKCDHLRNLVDEFRGVAVLPRLFVDPCADAKHVGVRDLVRSSQPRTYGAMGIEGFSHRRGRRQALPVAHAHVVAHDIAGDHLIRAFGRYVAATRANHDAQFALIV